MLGVSALATALALTAPARPADYYEPARPLANAYPLPSVFKNWTGFYIGGVVGGAFQDRDRGQACDLFNQGDCIRGTSKGKNSASATVGGTVGFNYQLGTFVAGVEGDYSWIRLHTTNALNTTGDNIGSAQLPVNTNGVGSIHNAIDSLGTVRGRLGYLVNPAFMVYGSGGLAFADTHQSASYNTTITIGTGDPQPFLNYSNRTNRFKTGWTAGGGVEYAFNQNWSVKTEAYYVNLGNRDQALYADAKNALIYKSHAEDFIVARVGLNYKF
jgi:outer membrane immunogenic protein